MFLVAINELIPFFAVAAVALIFIVASLFPAEKKEEKKEEKPAEEPKEEPKEEEKPAEEEKEGPKEEEKPVEEEKEEPKEEEKPAEEEKEEPKEEEKPVEEEKEEPKEEEKPAEEEKEEPKEEEKPAEEEKEEPKEEEKPAEEEKKEEPKEEKAPKVVPVAEPEEVEKAKTSGKWVIKKKSEEDFVWNLIANNGEIVLASESYVSASGAKAGLDSIKENINQDRFQIHSDKNDHYFFKLKNGANKLQAMGQVYNTKQSAKNSIDSVKRFAETAAVIEEIVEEMTYDKYDPQPIEKAKTQGKWEIVKAEDDFQAKLIASNGQVILVTERYASASSVNSAIENIKDNAEAGNFIIDRDKNNRYFYRLRNDSRSTLAIGETYDNKSAVLSAIESVRRNSEDAEIVEAYKEEQKEEK